MLRAAHVRVPHFDFSVRYVATNANRERRSTIRITGVWGALEGSIILWSWMLALYTLILILRHREGARELYPWALATMLGVLAFFLVVMTFAAPPFQRQVPVPADGRGLNPLLEDTGMITHPVALYLGFTGLTVPFAFAVAALVTGRVGDTWLVLTRRWTIVAWYFLSLGLLIGGWWSYHVLGWGGYWAWDPVENAAFCRGSPAPPSCSVMIQERRRMLKLWNIVLVILTFGLTLFGTFLTRSGDRLGSRLHAGLDRRAVPELPRARHADGARPGRVALGRAPLAGRARLRRLARVGVPPQQRAAHGGRVHGVLRHGLPILSEAVRGVKVSVGAPFFNQVNVPLFLSLLFLMGWGRSSPGGGPPSRI